MAETSAQTNSAVVQPSARELRQVDVSALPASLQQTFASEPAVAMTLRARDLDVENAPHRSQQGAQVAALFDIDGTLIQGSIVGHLVKQALREGWIGLPALLIFGFFLLLYKLNLIPRRKMYKWGYGLGAGLSLEESMRFVRQACHERILPATRRGTRDLIAWHRAQGHRLVAVTGAPDYAAAHIAHALGLDDVLATPTPIEDGLIGKELAGPLCYADGKIPYVRAYSAKHGLDLSRSYFYSDSRSDLPLLEQVGHPVAVNPQLLLRLSAWRRSWPTLDLGRDYEAPT